MLKTLCSVLNTIKIKLNGQQVVPGKMARQPGKMVSETDAASLGGRL